MVRILDYLHQTCQRAIVLIGLSTQILLLSCSTDPKPERIPEDSRAVQAEAVWFNAPKRFSMRRSNYDFVTHPFFDLLPFRVKEKPDVSFYLTNKPNSKHYYDLDLVSGELYRKRTFCKQKDIWKSFKGSINRPNFAIGVIPRLLDQTSEPQSIWVFGNEDLFFDSDNNGKAQSQRARVVGGVILQFCENYPCRKNQDWLSRLILVGVNPFDTRFKKTTSLGQLKTKVDWNYVKAFAENGFGKTINSTVPAPAYRFVGELNEKQALEFAYKSGHEFSFDEINKLRKNCYFLYDYIWRTQAKVRKNMRAPDIKEDPEKQEIEEEKVLDEDPFKDDILMSKKVFNVEEKEKVKKKVKKERPKYLVGLNDFFFHIYNKYGERYKTCSRFVRPANPKENSERSWFFAFLSNFLNLENMGYYYHCKKRSWLPNPILPNGKRIFNLKEERNCSNKDLDLAFAKSITFMTSLRNANSVHYKFLEFDSRIGGSHRQIFSWIRDNGKKPSCSARKHEVKGSIFPVDISWKSFSTSRP